MLFCQVKIEIHSLEQTINYAAVFSVTRTHMEAAKPLLETCAQELAQKLKDAFPLLQKASIRIVKLQPPITGFTGTVGVKLTRDFR
jgi:dihydroneopterin aldolase